MNTLKWGDKPIFLRSALHTWEEQDWRQTSETPGLESGHWTLIAQIMSITSTVMTFRGSKLRVQYCQCRFKRALKSNSPCIYSCSFSYFYSVISFSLLKGSLPSFRRVSVISCLYDLVHLSCSIFLFLCNKLLSNFLYCKTVICLFSKFCGQKYGRAWLGNLSLIHVGSAEAERYSSKMMASEHSCLEPQSDLAFCLSLSLHMAFQHSNTR